MVAQTYHPYTGDKAGREHYVGRPCLNELKGIERTWRKQKESRKEREE